MTHGWPGSVVELLETIGPLTDPTAHGGHASDAFDLVLPSLPGYGFSGEPAELGWDPARIARAWAALMDRLGYTRYRGPGRRCRRLGHRRHGPPGPPGLAGIHLNLLVTVLAGPQPTETEQEHAAAEELASFRTTGFGYFLEQATRPQTIGYGLVDSPVALAAWMLDHDTDSYHKIRRAFLDDEPTGGLTRDHILDNITLYWLTGTGASAARSYWESGRAAARRRPATTPGPGPGWVHHLPRRDLPGPPQLGRTRLSHPQLLPPSRPRRPLRRLGTTTALHHRTPRRLQLTPLARTGGRCRAEASLGRPSAPRDRSRRRTRAVRPPRRPPPD